MSAAQGQRSARRSRRRRPLLARRPATAKTRSRSDTRARREVVAQMLDYAANGSVFWIPGQLRRWFEGDDRQAAMEQLMGLLDQADQDPDTVTDAFWQAVGTNLRLPLRRNLATLDARDAATVTAQLTCAHQYHGSSGGGHLLQGDSWIRVTQPIAR